MILNKRIIIQKLDLDTEKWNDVYLTEKAEKDKNPIIRAEINKASGREYFNASTNITSGTYNFEVRYCKKLKDIKYDNASYRIVYDNQIFNIKNVDIPFEKNHLMTIVGDLVGR